MPKVAWKPQPRQAALMARFEDEALYGGAAGGGESDAKLLPGLCFELLHDLTHGEGEARSVAVELAIAGGFRERGEGAGTGGVHERGFDVCAAEIDSDGLAHDAWSWPSETVQPPSTART